MTNFEPPRERDYFKTWILFALCNAVGSLVIGGVAGGIVGAVLGAAGHTVVSDPKMFRLACGGAGFVAALPVSYFLFRYFVSKLWSRKQSETITAQPE